MNLKTQTLPFLLVFPSFFLLSVETEAEEEEEEEEEEANDNRDGRGRDSNGGSGDGVSGVEEEHRERVGDLQGEREATQERAQREPLEPRAQVPHRQQPQEVPSRTPKVFRSSLSSPLISRTPFLPFSLSLVSLLVFPLRKLIEAIDDYKGEDPLLPWLQ